MITCYYSFYKACTVNPGVIKDEKQALQAKLLYKFDDIMFFDNNKCKSCEVEKPARSKHCKVCDHCVEKFDHHCIWINQCAGRKNYKWFLLFLFLHLLVCAYAFIAGIAIFFGEKVNRDRLGYIFYNPRTG